jgi:hypothetical protein
VNAEDPNFLTHAFKSQYNLIGLGTALGFSFIAGNPLPLLLALGVEMVVLPLVAGNARFQRLVRARVSSEQDSAKQERKQLETAEMLRQLPAPEQQRYRALQIRAQEIRDNYRGLGESSQMLLDDLIRKLDFLLAFYLRMRHSLSRYESYFASTDPERIRERIAMLDHEMAAGPERVQQIKAKTKSVLEKRLERYAKAQENRTIVEAQTETVEEVLQLLRDQSFSIRDPRTITEQLDGLVSSAEETERGVRDMEEILALDSEAMGLSAVGIEAELPTQAPQPVAPAVAPRIAPPPPPATTQRQRGRDRLIH